MIGLLTAVVGDIATIFGCLIGLRKEVTAITFVAMGTSLPDLFASKTAAVSEKYADASIGNVTGSNSVNVFLGLGTPWVIAAIYHKVKTVSNYSWRDRRDFILKSLCHKNDAQFRCFVLSAVRRTFNSRIS